MSHSSHNNRLLVLAPVGRDATAMVDLVAREAVPASACPTLDELLQQMELGCSAVMITEEALRGSDISSLTQWVQNQPVWSDLPFIILTTSAMQADVVAWRERLVAALRNASVLERPVRSITLLSAVRSALRGRQRQFELRALLDQLEAGTARAEQLVQERTAELEEANRALQTQIAERARIEESLRHTQKMEAIGQLTGGVAHDFNNLLMVITGGLDMLARRDQPEQRKLLMDGMRQAAQRGASLTRQLLAFSRTQSLEPRPIALARQLGGMRELLERSLRGDVKVEFDFADTLWPVEMDPSELELIILNLAVNARDAMPQGGTIRVTCSNLPQFKDGELSGDFVSVCVSDSGVGMTPEVVAHLFEPFFTTKAVGKGSGLGLAQVYGSVRQSGGAVKVQTAPGIGTTITLLLPRSHGEPILDEESILVDPPSPKRVRGSVLMVEDNDEVASLVNQMLHELGYSVFRAASASAALGALANRRSFDIVFSDIVMPGEMDGVGLAREIRVRRPDLPIVLTSGYSGTLKRTAESEGLTVLQKPYDLALLATTLASAAERA